MRPPRGRAAPLALLVLALLLLLLLLWRNEESSSGESTFFPADVEGDAVAPSEGGELQAARPPVEESEPPAPVESVCSLPEFAPGGRRLNMTIFVFAWQRVASLQRLLTSLQAAEYCGHAIPLTVFVDGGASTAVASLVSTVPWTHGEKRLVRYDEMGMQLGIRGMWINASSVEAPDHQHVLPLEDDIEVSPLYYWWLLRAARFYDAPGPTPAAGGQPGLYFSERERLLRRDRLVGISLYTPRLNEISYPQVKWSPEQQTHSPAFLLQIPCSWGGLYFGSVWKEFLLFYQQRVRPPFFDFAQEAAQRGLGKDREPLGDPCLRLPASRSNVWPRSWKRFMIDFMYGRGLTMLYPNLARQRSFSTTYMERGGHSGIDGAVEALSAHQVRQDVDPLKTVPLLMPHELAEVHRRLERLPPLEALPAFDLHHNRRSRSSLVLQGFSFTENIRWWGQRKAQQLARAAPDELEPRRLAADYAALAARWSGVGAGESTAAPAAAAPAAAAPAAAEPTRGCALSQLWEAGGDAAAAADGDSAAAAAGPNDARARYLSEHRFLVYQPPGGLGEWFIALRSAAGVARALGRTLVVPHLMWDGGTAMPVRFSSVFDLAPLRQLLPDVLEMDDFLRLRVAPRRLALLRVREPRLLPARSYFDVVAGWANVSGVHMPAQSCAAKDYERLYGGCDDRVLAFSNLYAAFDGFGAGAPAQGWLESQLTPALFSDTPSVAAKAEKVVSRLKRERGSFSCVHLTELDTAVINSRAPLPVGTESLEINIDVAEPAARYSPFSAAGQRPLRTCDAYDAEAQQAAGRRWVKDHLAEGMACHVSDAIIGANLGQLPQRDRVFVLADGERQVPLQLAERTVNGLHAEVMHIGDLAGLEQLEVHKLEWPALEFKVCSQADALLLNRYSPISYLLKWRAEHRARQEAPPAKRPSVLWWTRLDSEACLPLFTRTARFDIQPNRFGILGQFGPERKLQLASTNISSLIGWNGKLIPNATVELEVYVSNSSHPLHIFEYTKDNNQKGIQFTVRAPAEGWRTHHWHSIVVPITDSEYSFPMSTPWEKMDRLELYYANPAATQPRGDYIRIRNVYVRSSRSYSRSLGGARYQRCSELVSSMRSPPPPPSADAASQLARSGVAPSRTPGEEALAAALRSADAADDMEGSAISPVLPSRVGATQARRRILLGLGVPLLVILLAFSFAPRQSAQVASKLCASSAFTRRLFSSSPEQLTWLSIVGKRRPEGSADEESADQTTWSTGHGARDAHHRNVVG